MTELRRKVLTSDIASTLVSRDSKAFLLTANFIEAGSTSTRSYDGFMKIKKKYEDANHKIYLTGTPLVYGWIYHYLPNMALILTISSLIILAMLFFYMNRGGLWWWPFIGAIVCSIWGLGFSAWLGFHFDPLIIVIPFLLSARAMSHGVQWVERFTEEYRRSMTRGRRRSSPAPACSRPVSSASWPIPGRSSSSPSPPSPRSGTSPLSVPSGRRLYLHRPHHVPAPVLALQAREGAREVGQALRFCLPDGVSYGAPPADGSSSGCRVGPSVPAATSPSVSPLFVLILAVVSSMKLKFGDANPGDPILWQKSVYNNDTTGSTNGFPVSTRCGSSSSPRVRTE